MKKRQRESKPSKFEVAIDSGEGIPTSRLEPETDPIDDVFYALGLAFDLLNQPEFRVFYRLSAWARNKRDKQATAQDLKMDYEAFRKWFAREKELYLRNKERMDNPCPPAGAAKIPVSARKPKRK